MKKNILLLAPLFIILFNCSSSLVSDSAQESERVSLIHLIASPKQFHGKSIIVEGYVHMESEGDAIYLSKLDSDERINKNAIFLFVSSNRLAELGLTKNYKGYGRIEGRFNKNIKGSYDFYSGTFEKVLSFKPLNKG